ncbi:MULTISPECIES: DUF397 domain-containing protein [Kitasatospora]|uniref:DUF397 domain-containing protein n=1 Tax=Kitasatospora TaxID=2063 RepID=UPI000C6FE46A|nr:DUF397 domain-containing protein [Kitasatospora sp. GP30]MDH6139249.1 hypothetical protein [Kitasatospora sp. GP30]
MNKSPVTWFKSSYSDNGGDCIEVALGMTWFKSSHCDRGGDCIEVSASLPTAVPVRDSKNPDGPALVFSPEGFAAFVLGVKRGAFAADA